MRYYLPFLKKVSVDSIPSAQTLAKAFLSKSIHLLAFLVVVFLSCGSSSGNKDYEDKMPSIGIKELEGKDNTNYPITVSHAFKKGQVFDAVAFSLDGEKIPTQTDVKVRYSDGSIKHALISAILPELEADSTVDLDIIKSTNPNNNAPLDVSLLSGMQFDLNFDFSAHGQDVSIASLIAAETNKKYWLQGNIVSELLINNFKNSTTANPITVNVSLRFYKDTGAVRVLYSIENCRADVRQIYTYNLSVNGTITPKDTKINIIVFPSQSISHNNDSRWAKVVWVGANYSRSQIIYDIDYLISTKAIPPYDSSLVIDNGSIESIYTEYNGSNKGIMENGLITKYFPSTGWRYEIGLLPQWTAMYLLSMNEKMEEITINSGFLSGSIPIHYREIKDTDYYGRIVSIDDRPTIWLGVHDFGQGFTYTWTAEEDKLPNKTGTEVVDTTWEVDKAHQGSFAFIPYLITGDYFFLEEMQFWAAYNLGSSNPGYRQNEEGIIIDQVRGEAWAIRNIAHAAAFTPDSDVKLKNYFTEKLNNALDYWYDKYITNTYHPLGCWDYISNWGGDGGRPQPYFKPNVRMMASPWQEDFVLISMSHLEDLGFQKASPLKQYLVNFLSGRKNLPWQRYFAYQVPMLYVEGEKYDHSDYLNEPKIFFTNWNDIEDAYLKSIDNLPDWYPTHYPNGDPITYATLTPEELWPDLLIPAPFDYPAIAMAAAAASSDLPGAEDVYDLLKEKLDNMKDKFNENPTFCFRPRE